MYVLFRFVVFASIRHLRDRSQLEMCIRTLHSLIAESTESVGRDTVVNSAI